MIKKLASIAILASALSISALAQKVYTPAMGSAERTAIMNALRVPVEKELKQKVMFAPTDFNSTDAWAFLQGEPQSASGGELNYSKTPYAEAKKEGMFDNGFYALLKKTGGRWKVVKYAIGCTDVCYLEWWKDHKAPRAIFPGTE